MRLNAGMMQCYMSPLNCALDTFIAILEGNIIGNSSTTGVPKAPPLSLYKQLDPYLLWWRMIIHRFYPRSTCMVALGRCKTYILPSHQNSHHQLIATVI